MTKRSVEDKAKLFSFFWRVYAPMDAPQPVEEFQFDKHLGRKHRFDFAFVGYNVAIELEGNAWRVPGGGKHMQDRDLEKYNIAASLGWRLFRFSPSMLNSDPAKCVDMVLKALGISERQTA